MSIRRSGAIYALKVRVKRMGFIKDASRFFLESGRTLYMRLCRVFLGIDDNKVVFSCFNARSYGDNLKPVSEALHAMKPDAKIVWMFRNPSEKAGVVPDYVALRDPISLSGLREYATAKVWVDNFTLPRYLKRRMGRQFYMNTWHGDRAFKKIAYDMFPERRLRLEETCDTMLAGSVFGEGLIKSAFRFRGNILNEGCPRNDCLVNHTLSIEKALREKIGVEKGVRVLLYAPTFRDSTRTHVYKCGIDFSRTLDALNERTGDSWICLYRAHQLAKGGVEVMGDKRLRDVTGYEDMADLLMISDALITDYSSSAMDFAILGRRVFIYQDDIEDYTANDRALYYPMEDSPFLVSHNQDQLLKLIAETGDEDAEENCLRISEFFGFNETGHAAESAAERICEWMGRDKQHGR